MAKLEIGVNSPGAVEANLQLSGILQKLVTIKSLSMQVGGIGNIGRGMYPGGGGIGYGAGHGPESKGAALGSAAAVSASVSKLSSTTNMLKLKALGRAAPYSNMNYMGQLDTLYIKNHLQAIRWGHPLIYPVDGKNVNIDKWAIDRNVKIAQRVGQERLSAKIAQQAAMYSAGNLSMGKLFNRRLLSTIGGMEVARLAKWGRWLGRGVGIGAGIAVAAEMVPALWKAPKDIMDISLRRAGSDDANQMLRLGATRNRSSAFYGSDPRMPRLGDVNSATQRAVSVARRIAWDRDDDPGRVLAAKGGLAEALLMSQYFKNSEDIINTATHDAAVYGGSGAFVHYQASLNATNRVYLAPKHKRVVARTVAGG